MLVYALCLLSGAYAGQFQRWEVHISVIFVEAKFGTWSLFVDNGLEVIDQFYVMLSGTTMEH